MARVNRDMSLKWVIQEEKRDENALAYFVTIWESIGLDAFPCGVDYLVLECCLVAGRGTVDKWINDSMVEFNVSPADVAGDGVYGESLRVVSRAIIWKWRRREKARRKAGENPSVMTNRINRVEKRTMDLISQFEWRRELTRVAIAEA